MYFVILKMSKIGKVIHSTLNVSCIVGKNGSTVKQVPHQIPNWYLPIVDAPRYHLNISYNILEYTETTLFL